MIRYLLPAIIFSLLYSCNSSSTTRSEDAGPKDSSTTPITTTKAADTPGLKKIGFYTIEGDSLIVPPFEIEILLSPKTKARIGTKETIIVDIFLQGTPKDPSKAHIEEDGSFYVGDARKEITYGELARFENLKISKKIYDQLADKDPDLTVNVYTGRKTSDDNLITGDFLSDKLSNVINRHFKLYHKLINGDE
jgi:hypothetical protein